MFKITYEDIITMHNSMINRYGGIAGIRDEGTLKLLCEEPYQECFGQELFPTIYDKATKYLEGFARHQVFYDGNKRTAFISMATLLACNDIELTLSQNDAYNYVMEIANKNFISIEHISTFLKNNSKIVEQINDNTKTDDIREEERT